MKKTKIICTIGPASMDKEILTKMYKAGMNVVRVNGAFVDVKQMKEISNLVKTVSTDIALMVDIKGNELRLNKFEPFKISIGDVIEIGSNEEDKIFPISYPELYKDVKVGSRILVDKAKVILEVIKIKDKKIITKVIRGELLEGGKGMNTPGIYLDNKPIVEKDIEQINFVIKDKWQYIAVSFVRSKKDIETINEYITPSQLSLISKIEDGFGIENIDEIIENSDGIMIARGDLAVEVPFEKVPSYQRMMIHKCRDIGKIVITATEMLSSMVNKPYPTRAEIVDVANAVSEGTDCVMLSEETTIGRYPIECIEAMNKIAIEVEGAIEPKLNKTTSFAGVERDAITQAAFEICNTLKIDKVVIHSKYGRTPRSLARYKLRQPIISLCDNEIERMKLTLCSNIFSYSYGKNLDGRDNAVDEAISFCLEKKIVNKYERILFLGKTKEVKGLSNYIFEVIDCSKY